MEAVEAAAAKATAGAVTVDSDDDDDDGDDEDDDGDGGGGGKSNPAGRCVLFILCDIFDGIDFAATAASSIPQAN